MGIRVRVQGPAPPPGSLLAPNHLGYADIIAILAATPCLVMTKEDVAQAPVVGTLVRWAELPYIRRQKSRAVRVAMDTVTERLREGRRLCVFLEGTSSGGDRVLPIKTPVVQGLIDSEATVVPVGLRWKPAPGVELGEDIAYWKDHEIRPHLWRFLGLAPHTVEIHFGEPIPSSGKDRKQLASELRARICELAQLPALDPAPEAALAAAQPEPTGA